MTEYKALIEWKRKMLAAEDWGKSVKTMQVHSCNSMWYEPNPIKVKTRKVLDIEYNNGRITRDGLEIVPIQLESDELIDAWGRTNEL